MTKDELIATIESEWEVLQAAIGGLTDAQMTRVPMFDEWTVKDILAHIAMWETKLVGTLFKAERGVTPDVLVSAAEEVDRLNARFYREQKDRLLEQVLEDSHNVHLALLNRLEAFSDKALFDPTKYTWMRGEPLARSVAGDSCEHYREHADQIQAWRQRIGGE